MKKTIWAMIILVLIAMVFNSCKNASSGSGDKDDPEIQEKICLPTEQLAEIELVSAAYPGVNVMTWKALKDAQSYTIYKTTGNGEIEKELKTTSKTYFCDEKIDENSKYKYRIVANPVDPIVHNQSEKEVTIQTASISTASYENRGSWAPIGKSFLQLADYESIYPQESEILSANTISVKSISYDGKQLRVKFPVRPYAKYEVVLYGIVQSARIKQDSKEIMGVEYNGEAVIDMTSSLPGTIIVEVTAIPLNPLYKKDAVTTSAIVLPSATKGGLNATWTYYEQSSPSGNASLRLYFEPASFAGTECETSEYTAYRTVKNTDGSFLVKTYIGNPRKDFSVSENEVTQYYFDDYIDLGKPLSVSSIEYELVLSHEGIEYKAETSITVPDESDEAWKYINQAEQENNIGFNDIYIDENRRINVVVNSGNSYELTVTYGYFSTYNKALVAVQSELPNTISLTDNRGYSDNEVEEGQYYAFRFVVKQYNDEPIVKTVIAKAIKTGEAFYWSTKPKEAMNIPVKSQLQLGNISITSSKTTGSSYYSSITLNFNSVNAKYYNIYRRVSESNNQPDVNDEFQWIAKISANSQSGSVSYTDTSDYLRYTELDKYVFYKVEAVGSTSFLLSSPTMMSGLKAVYISTEGNDLVWSSVTNAVSYRIYRAPSEEALQTLSVDDYYTSTYSLSKEIEGSYTSDYYYAVRAYGSSEYSQLSNIYKINKLSLPAAYITSISYTNLYWNSPAGYTGNFIILRCDATNTSLTSTDAENMFKEDTINTYSVTTTYNSSYSLNLGTSSTYKYYYAVATSFVDPIREINLYGISNVVEISYTE